MKNFKTSLSLLVVLITFNSVIAQQKNIILIMTDDLNDSVEGFGGHPQALTPNLDSLAQKGVRFTAANCNAPICGPSRASFITGTYPHTSGITGYEQNKNKPEKMPTTQNIPWMFEHFLNNGYNTYGTGKIFHGGGEIPGQFSDWGVVGDQGPWGWDGSTMSGNTVPRSFNHSSLPVNLKVDYAKLSDIPTTDGNYGWFNSDASSFNYVDSNNRDLMNDEISVKYVDSLLNLNHTKPFFITVGIVRPHAPYIAPDKFFKMYDTVNIMLPPIDSNDLDDLATGLLNNSPGYGVGNGTYENFYEVDPTGFYHKDWIKAYLANVSYADHNIGEIIRALEKSKYDTNTVVIFSSDHGYHFNEKQAAAFKNTGWGEVARVPFIVYGPGVGVAQNLDCKHPVSNIDIYPTLIDYAGISDPGHLDGSSILPFLNNPVSGTWTGPNIAITSVQPKENDYPLYTPNNKDWSHYSARSEQYRYILTSNDEEELYDEVADPYEWNNLADDPAYTAVKTQIRNELISITGRRPFDPIKTNKVYNGSFEDHLAGWTPQQTGNSEGVFEIDSSDAISGDVSFKFQVNVLDNPWNTQIFTQNLAFKNATDYRVSFWAKATTSGSEIKFQVKDNDLNINFISETFGLSDSWKKYSYTFSSTVETNRNARMAFQLLDIDSYNIDDLQMIEVITPPSCNGDFEEDFNSWSQIANNGAVVNFSIETSDQHEGAKAARCDVDTLGTKTFHQQLTISPDGASCLDSIRKNETYEVGFYGKHISGGGDLKMAFATISPVITPINQTFTLDGNYTKYTGSWLSDTTLVSSEWKLKLQFKDTGIYLIDSVYIKNVIDCQGVLNGSAYYDNCGTCVGGSTGLDACSMDCDSVWGGTAYLDSCSTCVGGATGLDSCTMDCNNIWGGTAYLDSCSICVEGSTGLSACVLDCEANWGGTAYLDSCSICVEGNTGNTACIQDCNNDWGGSAYLDSCSICVDGNTGVLACTLDCNNEWGGTAFVDSCDVCAGGTTGISAITNSDSCNVGIIGENSSKIKYSIFPNPSSSNFVLNLFDSKSTSVTIYSVDGKVIYNNSIQKRFEFGDTYIKGIYFVKLIQDEKIELFKIIKN